MDGRTGHGRIGRTTKCVGKQSNSRGVGGRREGKRERGGVFGENIRRPRLRWLRRLWRRRLFCIHFVRHLHCRQTEQPRSGRGRAASLPPSLGVLGVNSSSSSPVTSASTAALRRRRRRRRVGRRPKVWSPENLKRRTGAAAAAAAALIFAFLWPESACVRAAADHQLLSPSFLQTTAAAASHSVIRRLTPHFNTFDAKPVMLVRFEQSFAHKYIRTDCIPIVFPSHRSSSHVCLVLRLLVCLRRRHSVGRSERGKKNSNQAEIIRDRERGEEE